MHTESLDRKIAKIEARRTEAENESVTFNNLAAEYRHMGKEDRANSAFTASIEAESKAIAYAWALAILRNG